MPTATLLAMRSHRRITAQRVRHSSAPLRPSVFQAGHIPSWRKSCERYVLPQVAVPLMRHMTQLCWLI